MVVGPPLLHELASESGGLPILAHPAFGGVLRAAEPALSRVLPLVWGGRGHLPHAEGASAAARRPADAIADALRAPHPRARPAFSAPAASMQVERVGELLDFYGNDSVL